MEYGGCLFFEQEVLQPGGYYEQYGDKAINVDSGRSALQYILENFPIKRIWLPIYNCPLVEARIRTTSNVEICLYNLDESFRPDINHDLLKKGDALLWVNYCGVMPQDLISEIVSLQTQYPVIVIIDNIPAYFSQPRMEAFNIYSCRKFIGVPDGGHVIGNNVKQIALPIYYTAHNYLYLLKAIETGSNSAYTEYQESEKRFNDSQIAYGMPELTKRILRGVNYSEIINTRKRNFDTLQIYLGATNRLKIDVSTKTPSVYPYLTSNKELRQKLLTNKVYISRFWKHILTNDNANSFEKDLAEYLIPLPIDQRYTPDDMIELAEFTKKMET